MTTTILVLYYSRQGATCKLAKLIARGIHAVEDCEAMLRTVPEVSPICEATESDIPHDGHPYIQIDEFKQCDGLVLGSPCRFGNMAAPMKYFLEQTSDAWFSGNLVDKPAALFTSSSSMHGGQESTLLSMMIPLLHHGMLITGLPYTHAELLKTQTGGSPYGASHVAGTKGENAISNDEKALAIALGQRIATTAKKLSQG